MIGACRIRVIAAMDPERGIGCNNELLWHLPGDLKRFKTLTMGSAILMGRKTAESLGRALPGRTNLVLTRGTSVPFDGMQAVQTIEQAAVGRTELWVIGGGEIYALALPFADELHFTLVHSHFEADTFFPAWNEANWTVFEREDVDHVDIPHSYLTLRRQEAN